MIQGEEFTLDTFRFRDSSREAMAFHKSMMTVDHWITSDGAGFMLVEGIFNPGTKPRQIWFTVESLLYREPAKVVYYVMKNGLIYEGKTWWLVEDYSKAVGRNPFMDMLEREESVPDPVSRC